VKALAPSYDKNPVFVSVIRRGGHRTIQIILLEAGTLKKEEILKELSERGATYENANGKLFALDFEPGIAWDSAKTYLKKLTKKKWLEYRWSAY
jgi:hypothetical protein